ncbi:MAG: ribonuclease E/G [Myxococcota bacterium]
MRNEIFVNVGPRETRVAVRESDKIVELHIERANERDVVGGIYKGRVTRVLPGMQAAFVDIGLARAGFLYVGDYRSELDEAELDDDGHARSRRGKGSPPQIEDVLQEGREVVVQVSKEPLGTKGARITSRISLPGRHLVLMPWVSRVGVSRRIEGDRERRRLRAIVEKLRPRELGFIVRTVSHGVSEADIKADIDYLTDLWTEIQKRRDSIRDVPALVYSEPALHLRVLRDMASHETKMIVVDDPDAYAEMQAFVQRFMASPRPRITYYNHPRPMFDALKIENEIEEGLGRKVWLKSGGYLIFDQGEALTAVDVNTGRYTGGRGRNLEDTILKTNLEAVREIVHQLRFRNLGGLIILDLIDMESAGNREKVYRALSEALREDKAKVNILKISELGLVEMTRKRTRESLEQQLCVPCASCEGKGYLQSPATISNRIFRDLPKAATYLHGATLRIQAHPAVTEILLGVGAEGLAKTSARIGRELVIDPVPTYHPEQYQIVSEGARVELLVQPDAPIELHFEDAPESLASEDEAKSDELDGESFADSPDEPALDELAEPSAEEPEEPSGADFHDA